MKRNPICDLPKKKKHSPLPQKRIPDEKSTRTKVLLLEDEEDGVGQLPVLDEVVEVVEQLETLGPGAGFTDGVEESVAGEDGDQVLDEEEKERARGDGEEEVVEDEGVLELEGILGLHDLAASKDDDKVGESPHDDFLVSRQGGNTLGEAERVDALASDELVALAEEVIEFDAKGLINAEVDLVQECGGHCLMMES